MLTFIFIFLISYAGACLGLYLIIYQTVEKRNQNRIEESFWNGWIQGERAAYTEHALIGNKTDWIMGAQKQLIIEVIGALQTIGYQEYYADDYSDKKMLYCNSCRKATTGLEPNPSNIVHTSECQLEKLVKKLKEWV